MSTPKRRRTTAALFVAAALIAAVALVLAGPGEEPLEQAKRTPEPKAEAGSSTVTPPVARSEESLPPEPPEPPVPPEPPKVDLVFALDTTGSMSGLIEGAKRKIWSIANQVLRGKPRPDLRIGLIGYRDLGDEYVTRRFPLTEDIDDVYRRLRRFSAGGGGDTPEHVNRALAEGIRKMAWRQGQDVLRLIFLVGDAPPHEGRGGLYSRQLAAEAARAGIVINAVRCGTMPRTATAWRAIATTAGGIYASIRQDGGMIAVSSPMDDRLARLNAELSRTLLPTGSAASKRAAARRASSNASMGVMAQADSAAYRARSGHLDSADLLTQLKRGRKLSSVRTEELPAPLVKMSPAERKGYVEKTKRRRARLKAEIAELARKRAAYVRKARPKRPGGSFDDTVGEALKTQGGKVGIAY